MVVDTLMLALGGLEAQMTEQIIPRCYARPVIFVADIRRALRFYVDLLGFEKTWCRQ